MYALVMRLKTGSLPALLMFVVQREPTFVSSIANLIDNTVRSKALELVNTSKTWSLEVAAGGYPW